MEIRRSVMARPDLSGRGRSFVAGWPTTILWKRDAGWDIPAGASFPMRSLRNAGGADISARTLGAESSGEFAEYLVPRCRGLGMPGGRGSRKLAHIIELAGEVMVSSVW